MGVTAELKDSISIKEKIMRTKHPEIATHFKAVEIFEEIYITILMAREEYLH